MAFSGATFKKRAGVRRSYRANSGRFGQGNGRQRTTGRKERTLYDPPVPDDSGRSPLGPRPNNIQALVALFSVRSA
jgi:hypothetical protein